MPRRTRSVAPADAPPAPAETPETPGTPAAEPEKPRRRTRRTASPVTEEAPVQEASAAEEAPAPKRRGGRRKATEAVPDGPPAPILGSSEGTDTVAVPDAAAPVVNAAPAETAAPTRRRGRRKASTVTEEAPQPPILGEQEPVSAAPTGNVTSAPRRRGGRRKATDTVPAPPPPPVLEVAEPSPALPDVEAPVEETEATPETVTRPVNLPPPLMPRRGRRRTAATAEVPAETEAQSVVELSPPSIGGPGGPSEEPAEAEEAEDEPGEARRGRRGRRTRRRRVGDDISVPAEATEDSLLVSPEPVVFLEDEAEEEAAEPLPPPAVPTFVAPLLVPPAQAPADGALLPRVTARVDNSGPGLAKIVVNDTPHAPFVFFVNAEEATDGAVVDRQIADAASAGVHLFSGVCYLPFQNAYGVRSFGAADAFVQQILAADPDAFILPRLQCVPTNFWARTHEGQMATYADGTDGDVSLASSEFWADCVDALDALIAHFADPATPGGDRVVGFHLDRGEWFYDAAAGPDVSEANRAAFGNWLHAKYQQPYRLRAAWVQNAADFDSVAIPVPTAARGAASPLYGGPRDGRWPDFHLFASELVAQAITGLAEAVKVLSGGRYLTAVSYGYTLEFAGRPDSGHLALAEVLNSPHVDILAGPNSYTGRGAGGTAAFGAPVDSVAARGKLWLVEDDTKTFLAEAETPDTYNPKIAGGADTQAAHQRTFGAALAHRAGVTWMDLWGQGWLDSPDIWNELGGLTRQAARWETLDGRTSPDVAVFVDEASLAYMKGGANGLGQTLVGKSRELLLKSGASVGFYLQSDLLTDTVPDAKLYLFVNALRLTTPEKAAVQEKLQTKGKTLAWLYAPGVFDEDGLSATDASDAVGITLRPQPWNARGGSALTDAKHPLTERLRGGRRGIGQDEVLNPSYAASDPECVVLAEYAQGGGASLAAREHSGGWKSVFIGDPHLSPELLRGLYAYAGVPMVGAQDDVTHVADGVLLVHAPFAGQRLLALPRPATVYDVTEDRIVATDVRAFRTFLRARTTRLFLWGDADRVMDVTGLGLPDGAAREASGTPAAETPAPVEEAFTVVMLDEDILTDASDGDDASEEDAPPAAEAGETEGAASARRSRWQRRRAALRARRDAERTARESGANTGGNDAPVDMTTLLPDLPPRRAPSSDLPDGGNISLPDGGGEDAE